MERFRFMQKKINRQTLFNENKKTMRSLGSCEVGRQHRCLHSDQVILLTVVFPVLRHKIKNV